MDVVRYKIDQLYKCGEYSQVKHMLLEISTEEYTDDLYLYYIKALRKTNEIQKATQFCNVLLEREGSEFRCAMRYQLYKICMKSHKENSKAALQYVIENSANEVWIEKCKRKLLELSKNPIADQISKFQDLNRDFKITVGARFFLISKSWFALLIDFSESQGKMPGKIDNSHLILSESMQDYYHYSSPEYSHMNILLKPGLQEDLDFLICTESAYKYLEGIYSHKPPQIIRYCIPVNETENRIEIYLKEINLAIYPLISRSRGIDKSIVVSHNEKISAIIDSIKTLLSNYFDNPNYDRKKVRLWKMQAEQKLEKTLNGNILVPGEILDLEVTVEEACIGEDDILIVEHCKVNGMWGLGSKESGVTRKQIMNGVVGLQNLGNTCFMNSALQCVIHTGFMIEVFCQDFYKADLNLNNPLGTKGAELAKSFASLMHEYWKGSSGAISPWDFKKVISKFAYQFVGYHQHDSHELLSYLLTGLHEDLNRVKKKEYEELPEIKSDTPDEIASNLHWEWFQKRNQSILVDHMYGQCKSTLVCPDCNKVSITFDPVLTFAVAIPNSGVRKIFINVVEKDLALPIRRQTITVGANWTMGKLKKILNEYLGINVFLAIYEKNQFACVANDDTEVCNFFYKNIFAYEDSEGDGAIVPILITRAAVKGYFSGTDKKVVTIPRLVKIPLEMTTEEIHEMIAGRVKALVKYNEEFEGIYSVNIVNTSKVVNGIFFSSKAPCDFCGKKCENCLLPKNTETLAKLLERRVNCEGPFQLEIEWSVKTRGLNTFSAFAEEKVHIPELTSESSSRITLLDCLKRSCAAERLDENNKWHCSTCKSQVRALKTYEMYKAPEYLVLHLMRFKSKQFQNEKNSAFVDFPLSDLDLSEVLISSEKPPLYNLYAVSNHFGGLGGGHYTAYIKHSDVWFELDDSRVSQVNPEQVVSSSAYVLFYKQQT